METPLTGGRGGGGRMGGAVHAPPVRVVTTRSGELRPGMGWLRPRGRGPVAKLGAEPGVQLEVGVLVVLGVLVVGGVGVGRVQRWVGGWTWRS